MHMSADSWTIVSSISTAVAAVLVAIAALVAIYQLREMKTARKMDALMRAFDEASNTETSQARRQVLASYQLPAPGEVPDDLYDMMRTAWLAYDKIGIMVAHKMIPKPLIMEAYFESIISTWQKLKPYIE